jgi:aminopeptidase N
MRVSKLLSLAALALAGTALAPLPASAQTPAAATAEVPSDLPRNARPSHYTISIVPDAAALTFTGTVAVDLEVTQASDALVLHAADLKIGKATLIPATAGAKAVPLTVTVDAAGQKARFAAAAPIAPGQYRLEAEYSGIINEQANGLFALDYPDKITGKQVRGLFTQFEAPDARRFAPMFDEPIYKATFDLSATVPANQMAVSNMPAASEKDLGNGKKLVTFGTSPKMSSYLLFFALGDFERMAKPAADGVEVGIIGPRGSGEQARYALDELAPLVSYFNDYFGQKYPLPKLDNIAGPGQSQFFGAMENWGAIFTFESLLLNDPNITSPARRQSISGVQNHEVAHQWFGNLVTMAWWDDLWLNEGFASWMATKTTDHFHPDWYALLGRVDGREQAMALDAFKTTHPVVQTIRTVEEINQAFDDITYDKGEAVISMLEAYAGADVWREGLRSYMAKNKFGNSRTKDLWGAIEAAGAPGLTAIAADFTGQPGIPLVTVTAATCKAGATTLSLTQGEFSRDRRGEPSAMRWRVPLLVSAGGEPVRSILEGGQGTVTVKGCGPAVINAGQLGYYRSLYTPKLLGALTKGFSSLQPIDQLGLVNDQIQLSQAGYQQMAPALDLLRAVPVSANPVVARDAVGQWAGLWRQLDGDAASQAKLARVATKAWKPRLDALGLEPKADDAVVDSNLRATLIDAFGMMGDPAILAAARERFAKLASNPAALDGPLKTTWLNVLARTATPVEWDQLLKLAQASTSSVEKTTYFTLLGRARDAALAQKALELSITDVPGKTDAAGIITSVAGLHSDLAFDFIRANQAKVDPLVDTSGRARFITRVASNSTSPAMIGKLEEYGATLGEDARKPIEQALSRLRERQDRDPRVKAELAAWLKKAK